MTAVENAFNNKKPVLAAIHRKSTHPFITKIKNREDIILFEISPENRDTLPKKILNVFENK